MNAVLLTGAGFTKTFGGYLASEMWATILNQPEVQRSPELLKGMRERLDWIPSFRVFLSVYLIIMIHGENMPADLDSLEILEVLKPR